MSARAEAALELLRTGKTAREVADDLRVSVRTVQYILAHHRAAGGHLTRRMGRPPAPKGLGLRDILDVLRTGRSVEETAAELGCAVDLVNLVQEFTGVGGPSGDPGPDQVGPAMPAGSAT
jgi:transposase